MSSGSGFYKRRRGILEHLEAGKLSLLDLGIHDFLCLKANPIVGNGSIFPPGVWQGSATAILAHSPCGNISERMIQRSLKHLEKIGFIKRWRVSGKHGSYPILISRFSVRTQEGKEYTINAIDTTDWREPKLMPVGEGVGEGVGELTPVKGSKEVRSKNVTTSSPPPLPKQNGNFQLSPAPTNGKPKDEAFLKIVEKLIPCFLEKADKRSYALNSKPGRENGPTRLQMLIGGLKELRQAIASQHPEFTPDKLTEKTETAAQVIVEAFCKKDWNMGRDPKTNGTKYDDLAVYAFKNLATMERWLGW